MNKKAYIIPNTEVVNVSTNSMVCSSFSSIGGDAGVIYGGEETTPVEGADSRSSLWEDED
jgi:hypothetical protein